MNYRSRHLPPSAVAATAPPPSTTIPFYCSPLVKGGNNHHQGTCLDRQALLHYVDKYNQHVTQTNRPSSEKILITPNVPTQQLAEQIRSKLPQCKGKNDWCWADQSFVEGDAIIQSRYKPKSPSTRYRWLKTSDINNVLKPYEKLYPEFKFLGTVPLDFDKIRTFQFSNIDYCQLYRDGKTKLGAVFNLDTSDKRGSHWVSMYVDFDRKFIAFFDSVGVENPPKEIFILMNQIKRQIQQCTHKRFHRFVANPHNNGSNNMMTLETKINRRTIQRGDSECGVFSIYFITKCLECGENPDNIFNDPNLNDATVNYYRRKIFRPSIDSDNEVFSGLDY